MAQLKFSKTTDGSRVGELIEISKPRFTIGRHDDDLVITDGQLSRDHAWIELTDNGHLIHDCNSANGTWVNEQRITKQLLQDGDVIRFGETTMTYVASPVSCVCGKQIEDSARFCKNCGAPAPTPAKPKKAYPATLLSVPNSNVGSAPSATPAPAPIVQPTPAAAPIAQPAPAAAPIAQPAPASTTPTPKPSLAPTPRKRSSPLRFFGVFLLGGLVAAAVLVFAIPSEHIDRVKDQIFGAGPAKSADAAPAAAKPEAPAAPAGFESKTINLENGGTVVLSGIGVTVLPATGKGQGEVRVRRMARASDPPEKGGGGVSDVFDIRIEKSATSVSLGQPVGIVIPLATGVRLPTRKDRSVVLTRADATQPWKVERTAVLYHPASRTYHFTLPHLSDAVVTNWGTMLNKMRASVKAALRSAKKGAKVVRDAIESAFPPEYEHLSPSKSFKIIYTLKGEHALQYASWRSLSKANADPSVPDFIEDVGVALDESLPFVSRISNGSKPLFPLEWIKSLVPIEVRIEDLGSNLGESPTGTPLLLSSHKLENTAAELTTLAAHELIHVLQDRYYIAPYAGKWISVDTKDTLRVDKWKIERPSYKSLALVAIANMWFLEATADLWARRRAGALRTDAYWLRDGADHLVKSLTERRQGTMYAAAHFLDYLERKVGQPVAAQAMVDGDHKLSDLATLKKAVARAGRQTFEELFDQYARTMYIGEPAPEGFHGTHLPILMGLDRHDLFEGVDNSRESLSAGLVKLKIDADDVPEPSALLVIDLCGCHKKIKTYTYLNDGNPDDYMEKPGSAMLRRNCTRAIVGMGGRKRNRLSILQVNTAGSDIPTLFRLWLLLPPTDVTYAKGYISWKHQRKGLDKVLSHYNVYAGTRRLNKKGIKSMRIRASGLTPSEQQNLWVSVVDSRGYEWPKGRPSENQISGRWNIRFKLKGAKRADPPLLYDFDKMIPKGHIVGKDGDFVTLESPGFAAMMRREPNASGTKLWMKFDGPMTLSGRAQSGRVDSYRDRVVRRLQPLTITGTRLP